MPSHRKLNIASAKMPVSKAMNGHRDLNPEKMGTACRPDGFWCHEIEVKTMRSTENILAHGATPSNMNAIRSALFLSEESMRRAIRSKDWDAVRRWKTVRDTVLQSIPGAGASAASVRSTQPRRAMGMT
jgi:hypothetical protein